MPSDLASATLLGYLSPVPPPVSAMLLRNGNVPSIFTWICAIVPLKVGQYLLPRSLPLQVVMILPFNKPRQSVCVTSSDTVSTTTQASEGDSHVEHGFFLQTPKMTMRLCEGALKLLRFLLSKLFRFRGNVTNMHVVGLPYQFWNFRTSRIINYI